MLPPFLDAPVYTRGSITDLNFSISIFYATSFAIFFNLLFPIYDINFSASSLKSFNTYP